MSTNHHRLQRALAALSVKVPRSRIYTDRISWIEFRGSNGRLKMQHNSVLPSWTRVPISPSTRPTKLASPTPTVFATPRHRPRPRAAAQHAFAENLATPAHCRLLDCVVTLLCGFSSLPRALRPSTQTQTRGMVHKTEFSRLLELHTARFWTANTV